MSDELINTTGLKRAFQYESLSKYNIKIQINIGIDRELTNNDYKNISSAGEKIIDSIMIETYALDPCNKIDSQKQRNELLSVFGDRSIYVEEIPNGYCSNYCCKHLPWYIVTTNKGRIKIGWRKRVINIDWSDSIIRFSAIPFFPKEDVTKGEKFIHAWSIEKAKQYIDKLFEG